MKVEGMGKKQRVAWWRRGNWKLEGMALTVCAASIWFVAQMSSGEPITLASIMPRVYGSDIWDLKVDARAQAQLIELKVWPPDTTLEVGQLAQFYAVGRLSDGEVVCSDARADTLWLPPWTNEAECDAGAALLEPFVPQARRPRFTWTRGNYQAFDSTFYHLVMQKVSTGAYLFDRRFVDPDTQWVWEVGGEADTLYSVTVYMEGWWRGALFEGDSSAAVEFGFPVDLPIPMMLPPVQVDTIEVPPDTVPDDGFSLGYSYSPDRSDPQPLEGAVLSGEVYIFLMKNGEVVDVPADTMT